MAKLFSHVTHAYMAKDTLSKSTNRAITHAF